MKSLHKEWSFPLRICFANVSPIIDHNVLIFSRKNLKLKVQDVFWTPLFSFMSSYRKFADVFAVFHNYISVGFFDEKHGSYFETFSLNSFRPWRGGAKESRYSLQLQTWKLWNFLIFIIYFCWNFGDCDSKILDKVAQKMKFFIKDFFSKCGHIYIRNP